MITPIFESFDSIKKLTHVRMSITQKIHGTNAQVYVYEDENGELALVAGSRERWIYPGDDNYGFAAYVHANKDAFLALGPGRHFGEWCGAGINSGEGLKEKLFVLFNYGRYSKLGTVLPPQTVLVPVLYDGLLDMTKIQEVMDDLKANGSRLCPGFMRPEGVVININGSTYKKVFSPEETKWKEGDKVKVPRIDAGVDYSAYLQPIRLEKLLSRDERYVRDYPKSLGEICKAYIEDLIKEDQIPGTEGEVKALAKGMTGEVFRFIRTVMDAGVLEWEFT